MCAYSCTSRAQALVIAVTVWIALWSDQDEEEQGRMFYVSTLAFLAVAAVLVAVTRSVLVFFALVKVI